MRKITLLKMMVFAFIIVSCHNVYSQASLPFSYDSGNPGTSVTGLTASGLGSNYTSSPKMKFDTQGDYLILYFSGEPGTLTYSVKGNPGSGTTITGTFDVLESDDNSTYTSLRSIVNKSNTVTPYTDSPKSTTRYIKWIYSSRTEGNEAFGAISLAAPVVTNVTDVTKSDLNIYKDGSSLKFNTLLAGETVSVYNSVGQKISSQLTINGLNTINLSNTKGLVIVKVGNKTAKVVL